MLFDSFRREDKTFREERLDIYLQDSRRVTGSLSASSPQTERKEMLQPKLV
jgi:hypothetical protein